MARIHYYYQAFTRFLRIPGASDSGGGAATHDPSIQLESGSYLLLEDGSRLLLE